ncbi:MAG: tetraacyldisaccharide 4'-kinase [Rubrivivax sp.]
MRAWLARHLSRMWWRPQPTLVARALTPLAWLARVVTDARRRRVRAWRAPCPVIVVGNLVVGGAGKTPTVIALVQALRAAGRRPGVVSRGYGRRSSGVQVAADGGDAATLGDEPWLIHRSTGVPVVVGEARVAAAQALLHRHPEVDVVVADDGLQHAALARDLEVWVFDERGVGNGLGLPAGPLRQPLPAQLPTHACVLYNAPAPSTPLPGALAGRALAGALPLPEWTAGRALRPQALAALAALARAERPLPAIAGIAAPQRFFTMLRDAGITIAERALPDHASLQHLPWPEGTPEVICTEKDAAKLTGRALGGTRVWVVGLDFRLPAPFVADLLARLPAPRLP